ncbi:minor capsid protein [Clostridium sp. UBA1056]|uniref:minor capsid protein n=1 Tax=unclassified Clostridium TaxID=2614128 RepID=UPI0032161F49
MKDVKKIIDNNFKGKHFSERVWENENEVANHLHKKIDDFLNGKVNVNQIKKDIETTYNTNAYNAKRLTETEVTRCSSNAFDRFCKEAGVKKVRYNATLDSKLCDDCGQYHDKVFNLDKKIDVPRHPLCRCFYTIEDDQSVLDKTDYMTNRFVPEFGEFREVKLEGFLIKEKRVSNSKFNMWADVDATKKNKAARLYEKKLKNIKDELPDWFEMPRVSIIDFEKNGLNPKAIGGYQREVNTMFINNKYDTDAKILKYLKSQEGYFANTESNSPLIHELGHKYHHDLADKIAKKYNIGYNEAKERFDKSIEDYIRNKEHIFSRYINNISGYAADEFEKIKFLIQIKG